MVKLSLISFVGAMLLVGCGSDSSSSSPTVQTGVFQDSAVRGLKFSTLTQNGVTDENGKFKYIVGETVTFSLGNVVLGSTVAQAQVTPINLVAGAQDANNTAVTNMLRLLQTLDADGNANNGIDLSAHVDTNYTGSTVNFEVETFLTSILNAAGSSAPLVDAQQAREHFMATLSALNPIASSSSSITASSSSSVVTSSSTATTSSSMTSSSSLSVVTSSSNSMTTSSSSSVATTSSSVTSSSASSITTPPSIPTTTNACDTTKMPSGMSYTQSGNTINVSTNGCIVAPSTTDMCPVSSPTQTGINVLETTTIKSANMSGLSISMPMPTSVGALTCTKNAQDGITNLTVNYDVCYDITSEMSAIPASMLTGSAVTLSSSGTTTMTIVSDCMTTGASVINDAFTGEIFIKQADGSYLKM